MEVPIVNELLCYWQNNIKSDASVKNDLSICVLEFYTSTEITDAKNRLFVVAEKYKGIDPTLDLPTKTGRKGLGKAKAEIDDIMELWDKLMMAKTTSPNLTTPTFCAVNLLRIPRPPTEAIVPILSEEINAVKGELREVCKRMEALTSFVTKSMEPSLLNPPSVPSARSDPLSRNTNYPQSNRNSTGDVVPTWASRVESGSLIQPTDQAKDGFITVNRVAEKGTQQIRRLSGKKLLADCKVKSVPRQMTIFAGRLNKETTCEDMVELLESSAIKVNTCKKLPGTNKNGYTFKSAAFMISFDVQYQDTVFSELVWPDNCDIREWVFTGRRAVGSSEAS